MPQSVSGIIIQYTKNLSVLASQEANTKLKISGPKTKRKQTNIQQSLKRKSKKKKFLKKNKKNFKLFHSIKKKKNKKIKNKINK